jgi:hypothetical protein
MQHQAGFDESAMDPYSCFSRLSVTWAGKPRRLAMQCLDTVISVTSGSRLDEPLLPLFDIPEDGAPGFRRIFQFYGQWQTAALRLMENSFDNAHFSFVHRGTFGDNAQLSPVSTRSRIPITASWRRRWSTSSIPRPRPE